MVVPMKDSVLCNSPYCGSPLMELNFVSALSPQSKTSLPQQTLLTDRKIKLMVSSTLVSLSWVSVRHLSDSLWLSTIPEWPPKHLLILWKMIHFAISPAVPPKGGGQSELYPLSKNINYYLPMCTLVTDSQCPPSYFYLHIQLQHSNNGKGWPELKDTWAYFISNIAHFI